MDAPVREPEMSPIGKVRLRARVLEGQPCTCGPRCPRCVELDVAREIIQREFTEPIHRDLLRRAMRIVGWHIGDGDECGNLARNVYAELKEIVGG